MSQIIVSRAHRNLVRRLFELEIPEIYNGTVELKAIAREAGYRSKVAVAAQQEGVDSVGCCVGLRGIRIQNIVNELNGEKIDVVSWHPSLAVFISNALNPAQVLSVDIDEGKKAATVVVPDKQLSLAIGKEGQNARLAAKLTGWRIDIKNASTVEAEKAEKAALMEEAVEEVAPVVAPAAITSQETTTIGQLGELPFVEAEIEPEEPLQEAEPQPPPELIPAEHIIQEILSRTKAVEDKPQLRFAEELLTSRPAKPDRRKEKKKSAKGEAKESEGDIKTRRSRRLKATPLDYQDYEEDE